MPGKIIEDLRTKNDIAWAKVTGQLEGMEPHLEHTDAPGEWTTREVLSHLLGQSVASVKSFSEHDLPLIVIEPGKPYLTDERRRMSLKELVDSLDGQRRMIFAYLDTLSEADLQARKARIPLFKQFVGTDEISIAMFVGAMLDVHWTAHAGQLGKIRKTAGLPEAK